MEGARVADRFRVVIVGGGVAGIEAMLCLRELLGTDASIELVSSARDLVYRPLALAEPFGQGEASVLRLDRLTADHGVTFRQDRLSAVNPERGTVLTETGLEVGYDALLLALGARPVVDLQGALAYCGPESNQALRDLLDDLESGRVKRLVFASPPTLGWILPLFELALLTARHLSLHGVEDVELTVVSVEARPLEMFGRRASESVGRLLAEAGIDFRGSSASSAVEPRGLRLASGEQIAADRVVALPRLEVRPIPGIPQGPRGFIGTDVFMRVEDTPRVFAAGDATWFPIKQGGLAAQQADVAANSIAAIDNPEIQRTPFKPVLRGAMLTGREPHYMRAEIGDRDGSSVSGPAPLWWPPSKIAGARLAPFLAASHSADTAPTLTDLPPLRDEERPLSAEDHEEALELALSWADADANWQDYRAALRWLAIAEQLNLTLPPAYAEKRKRWRKAIGGPA